VLFDLCAQTAFRAAVVQGRDANVTLDSADWQFFVTLRHYLLDGDRRGLRLFFVCDSAARDDVSCRIIWSPLFGPHALFYVLGLVFVLGTSAMNAQNAGLLDLVDTITLPPFQPSMRSPLLSLFHCTIGDDAVQTLANSFPRGQELGLAPAAGGSCLTGIIVRMPPGLLIASTPTRGAKIPWVSVKATRSAQNKMSSTRRVLVDVDRCGSLLMSASLFLHAVIGPLLVLDMFPSDDMFFRASQFFAIIRQCYVVKLDDVTANDRRQLPAEGLALVRLSNAPKMDLVGVADLRSTELRMSATLALSSIYHATSGEGIWREPKLAQFVPICIFPLKCAACSALQPTMLCGRCHSVYYCNDICQKAHWRNHKIGCKYS
jgi:hypothetical protein